MDNEIAMVVDKLKTHWYDWLCTHEPGFKNLSFDERGEYVTCIVDYIIKYELFIDYEG